MESFATGIVFNIQRFSLHDGPGIRTTVFLKGCNLRCAWCHNPESMKKDPQISVNFNRCTSCGRCAAVCPEGVHRIEADGTHCLFPEKCRLCRACIEACPADAISVIGREYRPQEVIEVVLKDRIYYDRSGGGVTFSGGEPTYQHEFLLELLKLSKAEGLHTCIETNGMAQKEHLAEISPYVDLFLFDFKHYDDEMHKKYTGASNKAMLENLAFLNELSKELLLRCPIIPGINDTLAHFEAIKTLRRKYEHIRDVELMPYHTIGSGKWKNIGLFYSLADLKAPSKEQIEIWKKEII